MDGGMSEGMMGARGAPLHLDCSGGVKPAAHWLGSRLLGPASFYWPGKPYSITAVAEAEVRRLERSEAENIRLPVVFQTERNNKHLKSRCC